MSVTGPAGFRASGVAAGIKPQGDHDLALIVNDGPSTVAAGVFTTNQVQAAPVLWSQQVLREQRLRAVVLNSGGANACTGPGGFQDTHATAEKVAELLDIGAIEVAVCSTGLIGERLPMDAVLSGAQAAAAALDTGETASEAAARAILTTDSTTKQAFRKNPGGWSIGGCAKGAGMLAPNLATMLSVLTTDAVVTPEDAQRALQAAAEVTFGRIDVDGGTSTNDTVLLMASGASGVAVDFDTFVGELTELADALAHLLRDDAEGATKLVDITVQGADTTADAERIGRIIAEDNLVKTALFGADPNWGRIAMALGRAGVSLDVDAVDISINGVLLFARCAPMRDRSEVDLSGREIHIVIDLHSGSQSATILSTDLSHAYVEENSAYSS